MKPVMKAVALAIMLASGFTSAYEVQEIDKVEKTKEIVGGAVDMLFDGVNSDMAQGYVDGMKDVFAGGKEALFGSDQFCNLLQNNSEMLTSQKWFMETGNYIQKLAEQGNAEAKALIFAWSDTLRDTNKKFTPVIPTEENFGKFWIGFWLKKNTNYPGTYRCIRDDQKSGIVNHYDPSSYKLETLLVYTSNFMEKYDNPQWSVNFQKIIEQMKATGK